jgi:hypothetical protein
MTKLKQRAGIHFLSLKGFQPQQIQTELSDAYHEQLFQLPAVEWWHLRLVDRTRDLENEPSSEWPKKTELLGPITELLRENPFTPCKAI